MLDRRAQAAAVGDDPAPAAAIASAFGNWSANIGVSTSGRPAASAPSTVPEPPWQTTSAASASASRCGTQRSTVTFAGIGPRSSRRRWSAGRAVEAFDGGQQRAVGVGAHAAAATLPNVA